MTKKWPGVTCVVNDDTIITLIPFLNIPGSSLDKVLWIIDHSAFCCSGVTRLCRQVGTYVIDKDTQVDGLEWERNNGRLIFVKAMKCDW